MMSFVCLFSACVKTTASYSLDSVCVCVCVCVCVLSPGKGSDTGAYP